MMQAITKKPVDLSVLESMIKELELSETQRADLLASLRKFNLSDDNDPVLKITLATGIMARYMAQVPADMTKRATLICEAWEHFFDELRRNTNKVDESCDSFINAFKAQIDDGLNRLYMGQREIRAAHDSLSKKHSELQVLQEKVVQEVRSAGAYAERLNYLNSIESGFKLLVGLGAFAALILAIVSLGYSVSMSHKLVRIAKQSECNLVRIYDLHRDKFPAQHANDDN